MATDEEVANAIENSGKDRFSQDLSEIKKEIKNQAVHGNQNRETEEKEEALDKLLYAERIVEDVEEGRGHGPDIFLEDWIERKKRLEEAKGSEKEWKELGHELEEVMDYLFAARYLAREGFKEYSATAKASSSESYNVSKNEERAEAVLSRTNKLLKAVYNLAENLRGYDGKELDRIVDQIIGFMEENSGDNSHESERVKQAVEDYRRKVREDIEELNAEAQERANRNNFPAD